MHITPPEGVLFLFLLTESVFDVRDREINLPVCAVTVICGIWFVSHSGTFSVFGLAAALLPGLLILAAAVLSRGRIGAGDAAVLLTASLFAGWIRILASLFFGLLAAAGYALILLTLKKRGKNAAFPFLPFLTGGFLAAFLAGF